MEIQGDDCPWLANCVRLGVVQTKLSGQQEREVCVSNGLTQNKRHAWLSVYMHEVR